MVQTTEPMVNLSRLPAAAQFAFTVAFGCALILEPILEFVEGVSPRSAVLDAAVAIVLVALPLTYLGGVVLFYIHVTPPAAAAPPGTWSRLAAVAWALASALLVALLAFLLLVAGSPPTGYI